MSQIIELTKEMSEIYKELSSIARKSFSLIKSKKFDEQRNNQKLEEKKFEELLQKKEEMNTLLKIEAKKHNKENLRLREYADFLEDIEEKTKINHYTEELLKNEQEFRNQLTLNIHFANVLREAKASSLESVSEMLQNENFGENGPFMLDENY